MGVVDGYTEWVRSYENTVDDGMDLALLDRLDSVPWSTVGRAADLGCGTGRTAAWLRSRGVEHIDGVDLTPEMLDLARARGIHERLVEADIRATGLEAETYDVVVSSLVDEHLPDLAPLYREAQRLLTPGGTFVIVGLHPFFFMATGMPTHFDNTEGESVALETHVHLMSEDMAAARAAGLAAIELYETLIDDDWIRRKPQWSRYLDWPLSFAWVWSQSS